MKITKTRRLRFNMAAYEHVEIEAGVELDSDEFPDGTDLAKEANGILDDLLQEDIERADASSTIPEDNTFLPAWKANI